MHANLQVNLRSALIRPGRIDRKIYIGLAKREQAERLFERFYPEADIGMAKFFAESIPEDQLPMSALQTHLPRFAEDPLGAVINVEELSEFEMVQS